MLQVVSIADVSKPSVAGTGGSSGRLLAVRLTDGKVTCKGLEYRKLDCLSEDTPPGTKVQLSGVSIRMGVLLLEPKCVKVRAGRKGDGKGGKAGGMGATQGAVQAGAATRVLIHR